MTTPDVGIDIRPQLDSLAELGIELHPTALVLPEGLDYDVFERIGGMLGKLHAASKWWLADWVAWGEGAYGERVYQAVTATGLSEKTIRNYSSVAGRIAPDRRRYGVKFSVHFEVAGLAADEQERWLGLAEEKDYSVRHIRELLHDEGLVVPPAQPAWTPEPLEAAPAPDGGVEAGGRGAAAAPPPIPRENFARVVPHPAAEVLASMRDELNRKIDGAHTDSHRFDHETRRDALNWALENLAPEFA